MQFNDSIHTAYVALGSNLGDKEGNLRHALALLKEHGVEVVKVSTFICTEPYGVTDQPQFLNAVLTLSRLSLTAVSGKPTKSNAPIPLEIDASTSTG